MNKLRGQILRKKSIGLTAVTAATFLTISGAAIPAFAADETTTNNVTQAALDTLGVEITDPTLLEEINNNVGEAIDSGIINEEVIDYVDFADNAQPPTTEEPPVEEIAPIEEPTVDNPEVLNPIEENLEEQKYNWGQIQADWQQAFETVRADFEACIAEGASKEECAKGLGFKMQIAHGEALLNNYEARLEAISALPEDEQAKALEHLEKHRERTLQRLEKAQTMLQDSIANGIPLPEGVRIKNVPGEAELVNGLLQQLGSSEKAIPANAKNITKNSDGTLTVTQPNGEVRTIAPSERRPGVSNEEQPRQEGPVTQNTPNSQPGTSIRPEKPRQEPNMEQQGQTPQSNNRPQPPASDTKPATQNPGGGQRPQQADPSEQGPRGSQERPERPERANG